jgi:hypothetical protein
MPRRLRAMRGGIVRRILVSVFVGLAVLAVPTGASAAEAKIVAFDSEFFKIEPTKAQAIQRARQFNVIVAHHYQYGAHRRGQAIRGTFAPAMRQANPNLRLLMYVNGVHTFRDKQKESFYCHNVVGGGRNSRIFSTRTPHDGDPSTADQNYLMQPRSGWAALIAKESKQKLENSKFTGIFLDTLGRGSLQVQVSGRCINPQTRDPYTVAEWERQTSLLAKTVKDACGCYVIANGIANSRRFNDGAAPSRVLMQHINAGVAEGFLRSNAMLNGWPDTRLWRADLDMLVSARSRLYTYTKDWRTDVSAALKKQEMMWSFATFLLGADLKNSVYGWTGSNAKLTAFNPVWNVDLGRALGQYTQGKPGVFHRNFTKARVIVNTKTHVGKIVRK